VRSISLCEWIESLSDRVVSCVRGHCYHDCPLSPPEIVNDPFLKPLIPYRLELMDGTALQRWLARGSRVRVID
jgi:hypothetical protein